MTIRASIEPLIWENTFFGVNSAIVRFDPHGAVLTAEALQSWGRVQAKIPAANTHELDVLQQLGFSLVEGKAAFVLHGMRRMPAPVSTRSGLKMRCWAHSIINASFFAQRQTRSAGMSRCVS